MEKIVVGKGGNIPLPDKYLDCTHLTITTPYSKQIIRGQSHTFYFRSKESGDKPYIEDVFITIKKRGGIEERFEVVDSEGKRQRWTGRADTPTNQKD